MATPNLQSLYELYRQMYGSPSGPPEPAPSAAEASPQYPGGADTQQRELSRTSGAYAPLGGVLDGLLPSPTGRPQWGRFTPMTGVPIGFGAPMPVGPFSLGRFRGLPIPFGPQDIPEIPMPPLPELHIPESVRDAWLAGALLPWTVWRRMHGDDGPSGNTQEPSDSPSPQPPLEQPPDGGGSPPIGILGLLAQAARRQQSAPNDDEQRLPKPDPNFRRLMRVPSDSESASGPRSEASRKRSPRTESPPLVPDQEPLDGGQGGGGGSNANGGGDDYCDARWAVEQGRCRQTRQKRANRGLTEYPWNHFFQGCMTRARERFEGCYKNKGRPPIEENSEWSRADERRWRKEGR